MASEKEEDFDQLLIENMQTSTTHLSHFADTLQKKVFTINNDYLQLSFLIAHIGKQRQFLQAAQAKGESHSQLKLLKMQLNRSFSEITKRFSIAFATFSLT